LSIYPVPAVQGMYVLLTSWKKETDIFLIDARGQKIHAILTDRSTWISTSNLSSGVYLVIIPMPEGIYTKRIIVLKD
jgi:hypothetical protein